jgi:TRAP-type C4-dicarboxylate transport system substrate-binding protein
MSGIKSALVVSTAAVLGSVAFSQTASAADVTLRMANWAGTAHHMYHYTLPNWFKIVEKETNGRVKVIYDKVMLTKSAGLYDLARDGVRDITWSSGSQNPGRFPLFRFAEAPFAPLDDTVKSSEIFNEWYHTKHKLDQREMSDVKFLFAWHHGPGMLHTKKKINQLSDMKGLKVRAQSGDVLLAKAVGAVPVTLGATQAYEGLQRGTIEGTFFPMEAVHSFRLVKLVKYHLRVPGRALYVGSFYVTMNPKSFDGMPADLRESFMRAVAKGSETVADGWAHFDQEAQKEALANGNEIYTISKEQAATWKKDVEGIGAIKEIVKRAADKGNKDAGDLMADLLHMWGAAGS